mmetsp:Transcript_47509/g.143779  ORF Transcript_47509/g.143779 Transcript_47509/m.143779 type:complete len:88 (+) Transcript_47509:142-405(+)
MCPRSLRDGALSDDALLALRAAANKATKSTKNSTEPSPAGRAESPAMRGATEDGETDKDGGAPQDQTTVGTDDDADDTTHAMSDTSK